VNDAATAAWMAEFYRGILQEKLSPSASLRHAQLALWKQKRWSNPYNWAAFTLQGEWR
jgi:CHAT domain-containing protein